MHDLVTRTLNHLNRSGNYMYHLISNIKKHCILPIEYQGESVSRSRTEVKQL
jgi:hypothetical protein